MILNIVDHYTKQIHLFPVTSQIMADSVASIYFEQALHAKQSFQSNKTLRKPSGVLTTYQGLFFRKTLKKEFKYDLGGMTERKLYKKT